MAWSDELFGSVSTDSSVMEMIESVIFLIYTGDPKHKVKEIGVNLFYLLSYNAQVKCSWISSPKREKLCNSPSSRILKIHIVRYLHSQTQYFFKILYMYVCTWYSWHVSYHLSTIVTSDFRLNVHCGPNWTFSKEKLTSGLKT